MWWGAKVKLFCKRKLVPSLSYTTIFWTLSLLSFAWALFDRFALSITCGDWLLQRPDKCHIDWFEWRTPGLLVTQFFWIVSARTLLVSANMSFATILWVIPNFLEEVAPRAIEMNIRQSQLKIHKFTGIWLNGVVVVPHVLLLFAPVIVGGSKFTFLRDGWDWSAWYDPVVRTFSSYISEDVTVCTWDEVWRISAMIAVFCIMIPISRSDWMLELSYSSAMAVHVIAGVYFMYDMCRKLSHPLSWRFNVPFIGLWMLDRAFATFLYRVGTIALHKIERCGEDCFVLYGLVRGVGRETHGCGDNYWLLHKVNPRACCTPLWQRSHPYTTFHNPDPATAHIWNVAFVCNARFGNKHSWTLWLMNREVEALMDDKPIQSIRMRQKDDDGVINVAFEKESEAGVAAADVSFTKGYLPEAGAPPVMRDLWCWGPYRSAFYSIKPGMKFEMLVLTAAGTGYGYIIGALDLLARGDSESRAVPYDNVHIHYSARAPGVLASFMHHLANAANSRRCHVSIHYTGPQGETLVTPETPFPVQLGRLDMGRYFKQFEGVDGVVAYVCASANFVNSVTRECENRCIKLFSEGY